MIYYCPFCWFESSRIFDTCPRCGQDLNRLKEMEYAERLVLALQHPEPETRCRAAHLLGVLQAVKAVPALIRAAQETKDLYFLREIVRALGEINDPASLPQLRVFLSHPSFLIRKETVQSLGKIGGEQAWEAISVACFDPVESVRETAREIFQQMKHTEKP